MPAGGNSRFRNYPARMSERQQLAQLAILLGMSSQDTGREATASPKTKKSKAKHSERKEDFVKLAEEEYERQQEKINKFASERLGAPEDEQVRGVKGFSGFREEFQQELVSSVGDTRLSAGEESGAPCEMRRTPPQNKVDRSATGQSGSSPRVTLRINNVRTGTRDEKKGQSRPTSFVNNSTSPMETTNSPSTTTTAPSNSSSNTTPTNSTSSSSSAASSNNSTSNSNNSTPNAPSSGNKSASATTATSSTTTTTSTASSTTATSNASPDTTDIYEFKSSKEPTPVRGSSSSPNPSDKDKELTTSSSSNASNANNSTNNNSNNSSSNNGSNSSNNSGNSAANSANTGTGTSSDSTNAGTNSELSTTGSPSSKRTYEDDDQDDEVKRKKRKEGDSKDNKTTPRQGAGRTADKFDKVSTSVTASFVEQCVKAGKPTATGTAKNNQNTGPTPSTGSTDRKSPSSTAASSPKPAGSNKTDSDGDEDRKGSEAAPKVPPLKIVIPQSTAEQEQGARNGKNTSTRGHQLPYVVPSSNSSDSNDKDAATGTGTSGGTTSPTETVKTEDKKDFAGAIHSEERNTHHQRVLRSSHRSGNGNGTSKDSGQYSNSSPLATDRSNNSSPQARHASPTPETTTETKPPATESTSNPKSSTSTDKTEKNDSKIKEEPGESAPSTTTSTPTPTPAELHPRKRKMKPKEVATTTESSEANSTGTEVHPHDQPITNCYQLFLNIRKQIERRRKGLFPVQPKPPQGFKDYLMNRCTYVLHGNANKEPNVKAPVTLAEPMKKLFIKQESDRYRLRMQHVVEKEKLVLSVEQEILRVHGRAARALANQELPFSVCTILKDEEVYNVITPEQEDKERNLRSRYNGRLFLSWLQDVDDKWEKIKESMLLRHHNEAESLHAVQKMDWEWKLKEVGLCEFKAQPQIEAIHVPMVHVSDDFDLLPA